MSEQTGSTEFRLKLADPEKAYDIQVRYFHLKAVIAIFITLTVCLLYLAPLVGFPGIVVPESLNMLFGTIIGSFFLSKGVDQKPVNGSTIK